MFLGWIPAGVYPVLDTGGNDSQHYHCKEVLDSLHRTLGEREASPSGLDGLFDMQFFLEILRQPVTDEYLIGDGLHSCNFLDRLDLERIHLDGYVF